LPSVVLFVCFSRSCLCPGTKDKTRLGKHSRNERRTGKEDERCYLGALPSTYRDRGPVHLGARARTICPPYAQQLPHVQPHVTYVLGSLGPWTRAKKTDNSALSTRRLPYSSPKREKTTEVAVAATFSPYPFHSSAINSILHAHTRSVLPRRYAFSRRTDMRGSELLLPIRARSRDRLPDDRALGELVFRSFVCRVSRVVVWNGWRGGVVCG